MPNDHIVANSLVEAMRGLVDEANKLVATLRGQAEKEPVENPMSILAQHRGESMRPLDPTPKDSGDLAMVTLAVVFPVRTVKDGNMNQIQVQVRALDDGNYAFLIDAYASRIDYIRRHRDVRLLSSVCNHYSTTPNRDLWLTMTPNTDDANTAWVTLVDLADMEFGPYNFARDILCDWHRLVASGKARNPIIDLNAE